jgi:signal transduction histidine kinase
MNKIKTVYDEHKNNHEKLRFKDGRVFERFGSPIIGHEEMYHGYVWFFLDITEREKLLEQKDDFIGIATHELKTPVTSIKAYTQILKSRFEKEGDQKSADLLTKMDAQLDKLITLISDLLDVTKIEGGKLNFNLDSFDFNELTKELVEELQRTTTKHTIIIEGKIKKKVYADRERTGQVLTNFITNAIKYSPHSKKIVVHLGEDKDNVSLCVQDFGVGIPKDKQEKVFERFYRVSGPREDTFPGLGLGLFISSEIIKRQGGRIWVESTKGTGSTFCFSLPWRERKVKQQKDTLIETSIQHGN